VSTEVGHIADMVGRTIGIGSPDTIAIMNEDSTLFYCLSKCLDPSTCLPYQTNVTNLVKDSFSSENYGKILKKIGEVDPSAKKVMEQFLKMNNDDKEKFMQYLNNFDIIKEIFSIATSRNEIGNVYSLDNGIHYDEQELYNGDIVIKDITEVNSSSTNTKIHSQTVERTVTHTHKAKIFGIIIAKFAISCRYKTSGKTKVTNIISASDGWANYMPLIEISRTGEIEKYIYGNKAHAEGPYLVLLSFMQFMDILTEK
jgi:SepF-like predicted cell division protein (DUF552 family)